MLLIELILITIILFTVLYSWDFKFQYPKFNTYTISYYIFLFVFSLLIRKPFLNFSYAQATDLNLVDIYYVIFFFMILIILTYSRSKLWTILSYSFYKLLKSYKNKGTDSPLQASVPLSGLLPIVHDNSTGASRYWVRKALNKKEEADKLELVLNKLDRDSPMRDGVSRLSGFTSYIGDLYSEALKFDAVARKNQYRKMIISEPRFNANNSEDITSVLE